MLTLRGVVVFLVNTYVECFLVASLRKSRMTPLGKRASAGPARSGAGAHPGRRPSVTRPRFPAGMRVRSVPRKKKASAHPTTWVVTLANESLGYVPTANAFAAGGYEARTARSSKLAINAGQLLLEGALKALGKVAAKEEKGG